MDNAQVLIDQLPQGALSASHYRLHTGTVPKLGAGQILVRTQAFAITAGTRAGLQGSASYAGAPTTGIVMNATGVGEVVASECDIAVGAKVVAPTGWQQFLNE